MFMALEPLNGLGVVDLYAGSGALGIEALSRGAARADFAECDPGALRALEENLATFAIRDRARVWAIRLPHGLGRIAGPLRDADLVLLDPPYGGDEARAVLDALGRDEVLKRGARVVVEHHRRDVLMDSCGVLARARARRYGETVVSSYVVQPAPSAG
jgi:16S rRNA (guanine966-N2)-methyltransferase